MTCVADTGEDGPYRVLLRAMRRHCDPFRDDCWGRGRPITRGEVAAAIREGRLESRQNDQRLRDGMGRAETLAFDAERVAYLTVNPAADPVCIDVIGPHSIRVEDGCHRIAAAIVRDDRDLLVSYGGLVSVFRRTFRWRALATLAGASTTSDGSPATSDASSATSDDFLPNRHSRRPANRRGNV